MKEQALKIANDLFDSGVPILPNDPEYLKAFNEVMTWVHTQDLPIVRLNRMVIGHLDNDFVFSQYLGIIQYELEKIETPITELNDAVVVMLSAAVFNSHKLNAIE